MNAVFCVREDDQEMSRDLIARSSDFEKEIFSWPINLGFGQRPITFASEHHLVE